MRLLLFGFAHYARMAAQAKPHDFRGIRRGPVRRLAKIRALFPLSEITREIGRQAFPNVSPRRAWAAAQILWDRIARADAVAVWNGSRDVALAATLIARAQEKPVVYVENGLLPGTYQIDLQGINYASSLSGLTAEALRTMALPDLGCLESVVFRQRPLGRDRGQEITTDRARGLPEKFVLFAAQVHDDSQIRRFSPDFSSVEGAIRYVAEECAALQIPLVVKEHPSDHGRIDNSALKASLPDVLFLAEADNAALIEECHAFVTINSSMGLQAAHAGKPVFTLGDAVYNLPGIAHRVRPPERLRDVFDCPEVDVELRRTYLAYLYGVALVPCKARVPDDEELRRVVRRIIALVESRSNPERPTGPFDSGTASGADR